MSGPEAQSSPKPTYEEKMIAGVAHLGVFFAVSGFVANLLIYFLYRRRSPFLAGHSRQALLWQGATLLVKAVAGLVLGGPGLALVFTGITITQPWQWLIGQGVAAPLVGLALLLWVLYFTSAFALVRAWGGRPYRYPLLGRLVA